MTDFTVCTAAQLTDLYRTGSTNPVTVAQQVLAKIERLNPILNAFCFTDPDTTMAQAQASEQRWKNGQPLSDLDGVPVAVKDSILTQGWPTRHASRAVDPNQPWTEDAPAVARLREAGAVFVGKTTMSEFGWCLHKSDSILYGSVYNPWNVAHSPGGSSGGSAVAVAAMLVPIALGSDLGGSIAVPSAFCGLFGMKPSMGIVPQWPSDALEMTSVGPMARSTQDLAVSMNIVTRPDIRDSSFLPYNNINHTRILHNMIHGLRVAQVQTLNGVAINANLQCALHNVATCLQDQGARVDLIDIDSAPAINILSNMILPKILQQWADIPIDQRELSSREFQRLVVLSNIKDDKENLYSLLSQRNKLIYTMRKLMQSYDIILGPATTVSANGNILETQYLSPLSILCVLTKQPTVTIPIGLDSTGMPMAVMIVGDRYSDAGVLQVSQAIEKQFPMPHCSPGDL